MKKILFLLLFFLTVYIFHNWFIFQSLGGLDYFHFWPERLKEFGLKAYVWDSTAENGLGDNTIKVLWVDRYLQIVVDIFVNKLGLGWNLVQRIFWLWPYLVLAIFSPYLFLKKILPDKNPVFITAGVLVYSFNTYVLLLVSGGQMNIAIAYMLAPLVLWSFVRTIDCYSSNPVFDGVRSFNSNENSSHCARTINNVITAGLVFALQILFDLRMAYVTMLAVGVYLVISLLVKPYTVHRTLYAVIAIIIAALLHSFWLLPQVMTKSSTLPPGYDNPGWLSFLSWAPFSNTLSLLHPNWPENIFGKVYFMRPEFLLIPILAFSSLLFLKNSKHEVRNTKQIQNSKSKVQNNNIPIPFFTILGLLGAFLAKGVNGPFGEIYYWLFSHVPFFYLFRDPTKFYLLVALSYMILIPFSLNFLADRINAKIHCNNNYTPDCHSRESGNLYKLFKWILRSSRRMTGWCLVFLFIIYWLFLLWPVLSGQVKGTLVKEKIPDEYIKLEQLLSSDKNFSRTLWVPTTHRLSYVTNTHPAIPAAKLLNNTDQNEILNLLKEASVSAELRGLAVGYVIIPYDFSNEIFLTERKYDDNLRKTVKEKLDKLFYLLPISGFNNLTVYRLTGAKEHFFLNNINGLTRSRVHGLMINPTKYKVQIENAKQGDTLVFSERFDKGWKAKILSLSVSLRGVTFMSTERDDEAISSKNEKEIATVAYGELAMTSKLNSFVLPESGSYTLEVYYEPQKWVNIGMVISGLSLILCILFLSYNLLRVKSIAY